MSASWEDARRCPSDGSPGEIVNQQMAKRDSGAPPGTKLVTLICKNTRCEFHETPFVVGINPDGTIPDPTTTREKQFPNLLEGNFTAKQRARDVVAQLEAERLRTQKEGAEVTTRR